MDNAFIQLSVLLGIATIVALIARFMRQPLIVAYIFAGVTAGPMFFNLLHTNHEIYEIFSQFGVVLLLFIIGLNLNFNHLKSIGRASLVTGTGQIVFTAVVGFLILVAMRIPSTTAVYLAIAITFSSTIVILKLLSDKRDTETVYGKHTIGLMLVQDVFAIAIMVVIGVSVGEHGLQGSIIALTVKGIILVFLTYLLSRYLLPSILHRIADTSELVFIFTISWCFALASLFYYLGFSLEVGAIAAGMSLSSSPYQLAIGSRMKPLRDFFLIAFFIFLGSEMNLGSVQSVWLPGLVLSIFILVGNPLILYLLFRVLKFTRRNSFMAGLTAAQVSEFGFVILVAGRQAGHLNAVAVPIFTIVAFVTIFLSSYMITYSDWIYERMLPFFKLFGKDRQRQTEEIPAEYDIWVVGYHRIGIKVCQALKKSDANFIVVDYDPTAIKKLKHAKIPSLYGDVADIEFLEDLPIAKAELIVMTIPSAGDQVTVIKHVRSMGDGARIIANAYQRDDAKALYDAGADFVMMPHSIGGQWVAGILKNKELTPAFLADLKKAQNL